MILLIDNYDSFTWNLFHLLGTLGADVQVVRNDALTADEALARAPEGIVLSPGPCTPDEAGICLDVIAKADGRMPILGVCLRHQAIGQAYGGRVVRAPEPMHGKLSRIHHTGRSVFRGLNNDFAATRYHSLTLAPDSIPPALEVTANSEDGVIQGVIVLCVVIAYEVVRRYGIKRQQQKVGAELAAQAAAAPKKKLEVA